MIDSNLKNIILGNYERSWRSQYQPISTTERVWRKLTPSLVVDLLDAARNVRRYDVNRDYGGGDLLRRMKEGPWCITATAHEGGKGDQDRAADPNLHITVRVAGKSYHLRCKEHPQLHIIQITG